MKYSGQNSLALSPAATNLVGEEKRVDAIIFDPENFAVSKQTVNFLGALLLDAMKKLGQRATFEKLIKSHIEPTSRLAFRLTGNWDTAEELVQETMLRAVGNWESFRQQAQFKTWIYRILINVFRDHLRRQSRTNHLLSDEPLDCDSREQTVSSVAEANELSHFVACMIGHLPARQKEVLVLSTYESLSNHEIAETLGISIANVHSNLSVARKRLKQKLGKYLHP